MSSLDQDYDAAIAASLASFEAEPGIPFDSDFDEAIAASLAEAEPRVQRHGRSDPREVPPGRMKQLDNGDYLVGCPHCGSPYLVPRGQINCQIFRHGPIGPHASKKECDAARAKHGGCFKPVKVDPVAMKAWDPGYV